MKTILFQGDSITDGGRDRGDPAGLGLGYPKQVSRLLPECRVLNRGISGNRVRDLAARWQKDCLALQPDVLSILVGINDTWRRYDANDPTGDEAFEAAYRQLLQPVRHLPLLLMVPFLVDVSPAVTKMREDLQGKQAVVLRLAEEFGTAVLDVDALYLTLVGEGRYAPAALAADGVHPTELGHRLLAEAVAEKLRIFMAE